MKQHLKALYKFKFLFDSLTFLALIASKGRKIIQWDSSFVGGTQNGKFSYNHPPTPRMQQRRC